MWLDEGRVSMLSQEALMKENTMDLFAGSPCHHSGLETLGQGGGPCHLTADPPVSRDQPPNLNGTGLD